MAVLEDLCQISIGRTPPRNVAEYWDATNASGFTWLSIADLPITPLSEVSASKESLTEAGAELVPVVPKGTLLMSFKLSVGRTAFAGCDLRTNEAIAAFCQVDKGRLDERFLAHVLASRNWTGEQRGQEKLLGVALNKAKLRSTKIWLPPLDEQKRIVAKLDAINAEASLLQHVHTELLDRIQALWNSAVLQRLSKPNAGQISDASTRAWESWQLGEICDVLDSQRKPITKSKRVPGEVPYYGASGVLDYVDDFIFDEPLVLLGEDGAKWGAGEDSAFMVSGKSWVNNHAHVLRPHRQVLDDGWLTYILNATDLSDYITGVTVPKLNQARMRSIQIPVPPLKDQKRIVSDLNALQNSVEALEMNVNAQKQLLESFKISTSAKFLNVAQ